VPHGLLHGLLYGPGRRDPGKENQGPDGRHCGRSDPAAASRGVRRPGRAGREAGSRAVRPGSADLAAASRRAHHRDPADLGPGNRGPDGRGHPGRVRPVRGTSDPGHPEDPAAVSRAAHPCGRNDPAQGSRGVRRHDRAGPAVGGPAGWGPRAGGDRRTGRPARARDRPRVPLADRATDPDLLPEMRSRRRTGRPAALPGGHCDASRGALCAQGVMRGRARSRGGRRGTPRPPERRWTVGRRRDRRAVSPGERACRARRGRGSAGRRCRTRGTRPAANLGEGRSSGHSLPGANRWAAPRRAAPAPAG
jgi:hypothetical protein